MFGTGYSWDRVRKVPDDVSPGDPSAPPDPLTHLRPGTSTPFLFSPTVETYGEGNRREVRWGLVLRVRPRRHQRRWDFPTSTTRAPSDTTVPRRTHHQRQPPSPITYSTLIPLMVADHLDTTGHPLSSKTPTHPHSPPPVPGTEGHKKVGEDTNYYEGTKGPTVSRRGEGGY